MLIMHMINIESKHGFYRKDLWTNVISLLKVDHESFSCKISNRVLIAEDLTLSWISVLSKKKK